MLKVLIIFNPHAGSGRAMNYLPLIESCLESREVFADIIHTTHSGHAQELVKSTDLANYDGVVAAGGDGTLFELVNGLMHHAPDKRIPFGVIPVGTGNAFSRELGLQPTDWQKGIDIIVQQQTQKIDIGQANTKHASFYFINIIGMGFVVDAGRTTLKIKKLGKSAYTLATLWETAKLKKHPVKLTLTDANEQQEIIEDGIKNLGLYHPQKVLKINKEGNFISENFRLLYFYHNRLDSYDLQDSVNWDEHVQRNKPILENSIL